MEDKLIQLLESFGYPVYRQGSISEDESYPETFFTFWNNLSEEGTFYDNESHSEIGDFDVNIYSTNPTLIYTTLKEAKQLLKQNDFIITDSGHDVLSDEQTHTGRGMNVLIIEY